ncbi:DUF4241 domain-containing protein [Streptomyces sp. NPDC001381]|uniref:DUF4241 domain-containing protein n=1 Tax=Streptomyces sp. NPDC001381 TaxID=3364567 RepID=UPI0036B6B310
MDLALPTGQLVVRDPFTGLGPFAPRPFTAEVRPGRYPVTLAVVSFDNDGTPAHVAGAARLSATDAPVTRWELALVAGRDAAELGDREFFGHETDHGDVCFVDASAGDRGVHHGPRPRVLPDVGRPYRQRRRRLLHHRLPRDRGAR